MISGFLALLYCFIFSYFNGAMKQGSSPDRGQIPVEWGEIPSIRSFVLTIDQRGLTASQMGLKTNWTILAGGV